MCGCHVFCEDLNSNTVSKLFIFVWSYEGMEVMDLGFGKGYEKFPKTLIFEIFITFSSSTSDEMSFSGL